LTVSIIDEVLTAGDEDLRLQFEHRAAGVSQKLPQLGLTPSPAALRDVAGNRDRCRTHLGAQHK
jgi:hypothetical protein